MLEEAAVEKPRYRLMRYNRTHAVGVRDGLGGKQVLQVRVYPQDIERNYELAAQAVDRLHAGQSMDLVRSWLEECMPPA